MSLIAPSLFDLLRRGATYPTVRSQFCRRSEYPRSSCLSRVDEQRHERARESPGLLMPASELPSDRQSALRGVLRPPLEPRCPQRVYLSEGTRRLLAQPSFSETPSPSYLSPAVPSGAFLRVGGQLFSWPWLMSPSTRADHRLGFDLPPRPVAPGNQTGCVLAHIGMVNGQGRCSGRKGSRLEEGDAPCPTSRPQTPPNCTAYNITSRLAGRSLRSAPATSERPF